jgi:GNAT superfamily N-acetyltransferase
MIDWTDTTARFGYNNIPSARRPKVVCACDKCGKKAIITIRIKSRVIDNQMPWICHSCVKKNESSNISARMKKQWQDADYKKERQEGTKKLLEDEGFRKKHKDSLTKTKSQPTILTQRASASARALWRNDDYRAKTLAAIAASKEKLRAVRDSESYKTAVAKSFAEHRPHSSIQLLLYNILDSLGVQYEREGIATRVGYYSFDCLIYANDKKLLVECQGDYWHELSRVQSRDKAKFTYISSYFPEYEILYIWEHEFYCKDKVIDKIKSRLGISTLNVEFSFSDVKIVCDYPNHDVRNFLDSYHYINRGRNGMNFCAIHKGEMIACAVFNRPLRQTTAQQFRLANEDVFELARFCIHPSYQKKNFASWLISKMLKLVKCKIIVAYSDSTVGHRGTIYKASNFKLHHVVPADYWYVDKSGHVMHKKTLYDRATRMGLKEAAFAEKYGYIKKYGGEKLCFVKYL